VPSEAFKPVFASQVFVARQKARRPLRRPARAAPAHDARPRPGL